MKILQIVSLPMARSSQFAGNYGGERTVMLLCEELRARGHDITLTCRPDDPMIPLARHSGFDIVPLVGVRPRTLPLMLRLMRLARARNVDLLVSHDSRSSRIMGMAARWLRLPCVATMHGFYPAKSFRAADHIIAVSQGVRAHIIEQGVPDSQITTVYNSVNATRFAPPTDLSEAKIGVGLAPDDFVIGVLARLFPEKGHDWFLRALVPLLREFASVRAVLVGDGPSRTALEALARNLGIADRVLFAGYQDDVVPWLAAFDVKVLPSREEPFGVVLLEAGAMEKPVVGSDVGGIGEVLVEGETGFLVPLEDAGALQHALRTLINDESLRLKMGSAARLRAQSEFSVERMVTQHEAVYRRAAHKKSN